MTYVLMSGGVGLHVQESIDEVMSEKERADTKARVGAHWGYHGRNDRWMRLTPKNSTSRLYVLDPAHFVGVNGELR